MAIGAPSCDGHLDVVAGHDHLDALGQVRLAGHVGRAEVELRAVAAEERGVAAALVLGQDVDLGRELRVRRDRAGLGQDLAPRHLVLVDPAEQDPDVVAGLHLVQELAEHLEVGRDRLAGVLDADDLDLLHLLQHPLLDPPGDHGAPAGDREDVLDRHQERLVDVADGLGDVAVAPPRAARRSSSSPPRRPRAPSAPTPGSPARRRRGTRRRTGARGPRARRGRAARGRPPCRPCSARPRCTGRRPGGRAARARASAASGRRPRDTTRIAPSTWAAPVIMFLM